MRETVASHRLFRHSSSRTARMAAAAMAIMLSASLLPACNQDKETVVVYTSVDQVYSEKIFKAYEQETGVRVEAKYDIEAAKTIGLVNELIAEKDNPQADVFWSGEILYTIDLKEKGVLDTAVLENTKNLPPSFIDEDNMWFAFGGRARVLLFNKTLISKEECPRTMEELLTSGFVSKTGIANPIFGTTATHAAVLYAHWGSGKAKTFYSSLYDAGIVMLEGNGPVKDQVSQKKIFMGLTDTDDALVEMARNPDLDIVFLDQGEDGMGTLVIPNTVAKIRGGPNPEQAERFMDYLLSVEVEQMLVDNEWIQIPVNSGLDVADVVEQANIKIMAADFNKAYTLIEESKTDLTAIFVR
ncbi:MAG: extracellular solute-binding protein [Saccharofermentanales bacterium]